MWTTFAFSRRMRWLIGVPLVLLAVFVAMPFLAGQEESVSSSPRVETVGIETDDVATQAGDLGQRRTIAAQTPASPVTRAEQIPIDPKRCYDMLKAICSLGARPSGSPGMQKQQLLLTKYFENLGAQVVRQEFQVPHPLTGEPVTMTNLIVSLHPQTQQRILLCAHYDTRPFPDRDPFPGGRRGVFVGANDGASGVAVLAELARHLQDWDRDFGVDLVLFDGEEFVFHQRDKYFYGSEHFAQEYVRTPPGHRYRWGVLLDMVGDADLTLFQERNSATWPDTRALVQDIWNTAARLGVREFIPRIEYELQDDHLALRNIAKIPTCDVIDFYYPQPPGGLSFWHTRADTPDKCSGESLAKVGWVILEWLRQVRWDAP